MPNRCQTKTKKGVLCQKWTSKTPNEPSSENWKYAQEKTHGLGDHNYCRNPDGEKTIYCYTMEAGTFGTSNWDYCEPLEPAKGKKEEEDEKEEEEKKAGDEKKDGDAECDKTEKLTGEKDAGYRG